MEGRSAKEWAAASFTGREMRAALCDTRSKRRLVLKAGVTAPNFVHHEYRPDKNEGRRAIKTTTMPNNKYATTFDEKGKEKTSLKWKERVKECAHGGRCRIRNSQFEHSIN